jgi:hypothetical protein
MSTPAKAGPVKAVPEGYHTVTPYLVVQGAAKLIDFLKAAFDAREIVRHPAGVQHGQVALYPTEVTNWPPFSPRHRHERAKTSRNFDGERRKGKRAPLRFLSLLLRRSREVTHWCSDRVTHAKNRPCPRARDETGGFIRAEPARSLYPTREPVAGLSLASRPRTCLAPNGAFWWVIFREQTWVTSRERRSIAAGHSLGGAKGSVCTGGQRFSEFPAP